MARTTWPAPARADVQSLYLWAQEINKLLRSGEILSDVNTAPTDAEYLVGTANAGLSAERVVTDTPSIAWDLATAGQAKAKRAALTGDVTAAADGNAMTIANNAVIYAKMQDVSAASRLLGRGSAAGAGDPQEISLGTGLSMSGTTLNGTGGIGQIVIQTFTASGTYTPTAGMKYCIIEVQAPGGGGGGADGTGGAVSAGVNSGGGGGGEYAKGVFSAAAIGSSQTITIGAPGTAGSNTGGDGGTGGTSSVGALLTAIGGNGGVGSGSNSVNDRPHLGGAGGTGGSGGAFRIAGGDGGPGTSIFNNDSAATIFNWAGDGGSSFFAAATKGPIATAGSAISSAGTNGNNYGSGGSGAISSSTTGVAGGAGAASIIVITEFI